MSTAYPLSSGDTLVLRVDAGPWLETTFAEGSFQESGRATADEVAAVVDALPGVSAAVDDDGRLVLATEAAGGHVSLEVDPGCSAASALGIDGGHASANGSGLVAARLVGLSAEPFPLRRRARMVLAIDGRRRRVSFDGGFKTGSASAEDVAGVINAKVGRQVAIARGDGHIALTSPTVGLKSSLKVERDQGDGQDAAEVLGFVGEAAVSHPYWADPARLVCVPAPERFSVLNMTSAPIELHLFSGAIVVPARASVPLSGGGAGEVQLQSLVEQGAVVVVPDPGPAGPPVKGEAVDGS